MALGLDSLAGALAEADCVIVTTAAPAPVVDLETVSTALPARVGRRLAPLVIVDLSVPRNVDPSVGGLGGVELLDIGALRASPTVRSPDGGASSSRRSRSCATRSSATGPTREPEARRRRSRSCAEHSRS